jgi:hypothetical protein
MKSMQQKTNLFADGGMKDDAGTVEPTTGNVVPPGALKNEVADDVSAKLSEGEFVFPADVVRYFGLQKLMSMRDEAKIGLQKMNEIGQMGNADQVSNPEALHGDHAGFAAEVDNALAEHAAGSNHFAIGGAVRRPMPAASRRIAMPPAFSNVIDKIRPTQGQTQMGRLPLNSAPLATTQVTPTPAGQLPLVSTQAPPPTSQPSGVDMNAIIANLQNAGQGTGQLGTTSTFKPITAAPQTPIASSTGSTQTADLGQLLSTSNKMTPEIQAMLNSPEYKQFQDKLKAASDVNNAAIAALPEAQQLKALQSSLDPAVPPTAEQLSQMETLNKAIFNSPTFQQIQKQQNDFYQQNNALMNQYGVNKVSNEPIYERNAQILPADTITSSPLTGLTKQTLPAANTQTDMNAAAVMPYTDTTLALPSSGNKVEQFGSTANQMANMLGNQQPTALPAGASTFSEVIKPAPTDQLSTMAPPQKKQQTDMAMVAKGGLIKKRNKTK